MRLPGGLGELTYCLNVHPTQNWEESRAALCGPARAVKAAICPDAPFAIGMRLSAETQAALQVELATLGKRRYRLTVDEFHREVGTALVRCAGTEDIRDVRMAQARQQRALAFEPRQAIGHTQRRTYDLERDETGRIDLARAKHGAHASAIDGSFDLEALDIRQRLFQQLAPELRRFGGRYIGGEQGFDFRAKFRIVGATFGEQTGSSLGIEFDHFAEKS